MARTAKSVRPRPAIGLIDVVHTYPFRFLCRAEVRVVDVIMKLAHGENNSYIRHRHVARTIVRDEARFDHSKFSTALLRVYVVYEFVTSLRDKRVHERCCVVVVLDRTESRAAHPPIVPLSRYLSSRTDGVGNHAGTVTRGARE